MLIYPFQVSLPSLKLAKHRDSRVYSTYLLINDHGLWEVVTIFIYNLFTIVHSIRYIHFEVLCMEDVWLDYSSKKTK